MAAGFVTRDRDCTIRLDVVLWARPLEGWLSQMPVSRGRIRPASGPFPRAWSAGGSNSYYLARGHIYHHAVIANRLAGVVWPPPEQKLTDRVRERTERMRLRRPLRHSAR